MRLSAALAAALVCAACVATAAADPRAGTAPFLRAGQSQPVGGGAQGRGKPIVILNDSGGNVLQAIARREDLRRSGRPVEVRGYCRSACTIYITLPNACLGPRATVGFHAPRIAGTQIIPPLVDQIVADYYRGGIRRMWMSEWRHSREMVKISAREYVRLDPQTRLCPG